MKRLLKGIAGSFGFQIRRIQKIEMINGRPSLYRPHYSPWLSDDFQKIYSIAAPRTLVSPDRCYVLYILLSQALHLEGDIAECGVYKGGTAAMMADVIAKSGSKDKKLYLFDTFEGMPDTDEVRDLHKKGDFADTSAEEVEKFVL